MCSILLCRAPIVVLDWTNSNSMSKYCSGTSVPLAIARVVVSACARICDCWHFHRLQDVANVAHKHLDRLVGVSCSTVHLYHPCTSKGGVISQALAFIKFNIE